MLSAGRRLGVALVALLLLTTGCSSEATDIAEQTCADATSGNGDAPQVMADGFQRAEDAGISEADYRDALLKECAMEPPPRDRLDAIIDG